MTIKKDINIRKIEALTFDNMEELKAEGKAEKIDIKGHQCYFVELGDYFKYSVVVFKNKHHIHYANDYELHHLGKTKEELKQWYLETLSRKLYTEEELQTVTDYHDYTHKLHYLQNYWIMQYDYISYFHIGEYSEEDKKKIEKLVECDAAYAYLENVEVVNRFMELQNQLRKAHEEIKNTEKFFRESISYELSNHEAGYTCDYRDTLDSLGLKYETMEEWQKKILLEEFNKQVNACM